MDTSPEYINMCRKAKELREMWEPKEGDWFYRKVRWVERVVTIGRFSMQEFNHQKQYDPALSREIKKQSTEIWLPRIDQLCCIIREHYNSFSPRHWTDGDVFFSLFDYEHSDGVIKISCTVEQYMLMELYNIKYNKSWNGEDWI